MRGSGKYRLGWYAWLWLLIGGISGLSILLLTVGRFKPVLAVGGVVVIVILAGVVLGLRLALERDHRFTPLLFAILLAALLFRWGPYPHQIVGQDQGLYVSMARIYARTGSLSFPDPLRDSLTEQQRKLYDANGGAFTDGFVPVDNNKSIIQPRFYPLHPAWMAIFAQGLGESRGGYAVVFFALLGISGLYLLTLEISRNQLAAYGAALFAALNPGLVFFAKFPISEMAALAFTANGFYFLCRGYRQLRQDQACWINLALAAGCFNCFFYTRMSAVYYLPFFLFLYVACLVTLPDPRQRAGITRFFCCLAILFGLALIFYYQCLPHQYAVVTRFFKAAFRPYKISVLAGMGVLVMGSVLLAWWVKSPPRRLRAQNLLEKLRVLAPALILLALAVHPVWALLAHEHANFGSRKFIADVSGWRMLFYASIYRYLLYLSPVGMALLVLGPWGRRIRTNGLAVLAVVFVAFMMAVCWFRPYAPYAFYYDRYYLSEVIPYGLMVVAMVLAPAAPVGLGAVILGQRREGIEAAPDLFESGRPTENAAVLLANWWRGGLAALIAVYYAFFSWCQLGQIEGSYPDFFDQVNHTVGANDLLLYEDVFGRPIKGTLVAYFNLKVFPVQGEADLARPEIAALANQYANVYFLSSKQYRNPAWPCARVLRYAEGFFIAGSHAWTDSSVKIMKNSYDGLLPFKHYEFSTPFYMYRLAPRKPV